jgi:hypothetical protein
MSTIATSPEVQSSTATIGDSANELYRLVEEHFDEMGLTEEERDERYSRAERRVIAQDAADARPAA